MPEAASRMHQHPGDMTARMRAVRLGPSGLNRRKILRVAIVQGGQVLAEQCFERTQSITIGPAQTDSFVVVDAAFSESTRIFETGKTRRIHVPSGAHLRLSADDGPVSMKTGDARSILLGDTSRGRLTLGRTTVLFSIEPEPDKAPQLRLPPSIKRGLEIDWTTTVIAAFSFLFHFGVLGSLYSEWQDPLIDDGLTIAKLVETIQDLPTPPPVEDTAEEEATDVHTPKVSKEEKREDPKRAKQAPDVRRADATSPRARDTARQRAQLRSQLDEIDVLMHGSLTATGPSTDRVIRDSNMPLALLDAAAARDAAVSRRPNDLALSPSDMSSVERNRSLDRLANRDGGEQAGSGRAKETDGPKVKADKTAEDPTRQPVSPELPDAQAVIGRLQGSFRRCYQNGLDRENSDMQGSVRITLRVGPNGEVTSATAGAVSGTLSGSVVSCMLGRASTAQFKPPKGGGAVLVVPVISRKQ